MDSFQSVFRFAIIFVLIKLLNYNIGTDWSSWKYQLIVNHFSGNLKKVARIWNENVQFTAFHFSLTLSLHFCVCIICIYIYIYKPSQCQLFPWIRLTGFLLVFTKQRNKNFNYDGDIIFDLMRFHGWYSLKSVFNKNKFTLFSYFYPSITGISCFFTLFSVHRHMSRATCRFFSKTNANVFIIHYNRNRIKIYVSISEIGILNSTIQFVMWYSIFDIVDKLSYIFL